MITQHDLDEAIEACRGKLNPNRDDALLLAACYTIQQHLYPAESQDSGRGYSMAGSPASGTADGVGDFGDSEFLRAISGRDPAAMWRIMDDLMDTMRMINRRVYDGVMRKIEQI